MGQHAHFGQNDFRLTEALDYQAGAAAPVDGNGIGWWSGANGGAGGWQPQQFVNQYQRATIGGGVALGAVTSPWQPNANTANDQTANAAADLTIGPPTNGVGTQRLLLVVTATGASRLITLDAAIGLVAGYPRTLQLPDGKRCFILLRYTGAVWTALAFSPEG